MQTEVGIGIISCNRSPYLRGLLESIFSYDARTGTIIVFDDASTDDSAEVASKFCETISSKKRSGVIVNKNRALYYFHKVNPKKLIILLEEDTLINKKNWIEEWSQATMNYGHMNYTHPAFLGQQFIHRLVRGSGQPDNPHIFRSLVTGQCTSIKSDLLDNDIGYLNPRFSGYGYGHVEWTNRCVLKGFGGYKSGEILHYYSIPGGIDALPSPTHKNPEDMKKNKAVYEEICKSGTPPFIPCPWLNKEESNQFTTL